MKLEFAARVDIGIKESNDDRVLVGGELLAEGTCDGEFEIPGVAVVCDGCGGYAGGFLAAETVLVRIAQAQSEALGDEAYLAQVLEDCQRAVAEKKRDIPRFLEMCTTVAGCVFCEDRILVFHSGDSRVYRMDRWGLARMTKDHSAVQKMVDCGELLPEEARKHPQRNVISRGIGIECLPPEIYLSRSCVHPGEMYLLCSDGLWESVDDSEISALLGRDLSLGEMADELVNLALSHGADDNISVCICACSERK